MEHIYKLAIGVAGFFRQTCQKVVAGFFRQTCQEVVLAEKSQKLTSHHSFLHLLIFLGRLLKIA